MSSALRIPVFDTDYEPRLETRLERRRRNYEYREQREQHEDREFHEHNGHQENDDALNRLPGQMVNLAGAAVIGSMGIGLMGMMLKK